MHRQKNSIYVIMIINKNDKGENVMQVFEIKKKLENLKEMPEEAKQTLLEAMSMTQTWLNLEDLKQILPEEQYVDIETKVKEIYEKRFPEKEGWAKEKIEALRSESVKNDEFFVVKDKNGEFALRRMDFSDILEVHLKEITKENLEKFVLKKKKKHRQYDTFHENEQLTAEEIPEVLDSAIASISATKHRGITPDNIEGAASGVRIEEFRNASGNLRREIKELENEKDGTSLGDE